MRTGKKKSDSGTFKYTMRRSPRSEGGRAAEKQQESWLLERIITSREMAVRGLGTVLLRNLRGPEEGGKIP